MKLIIKKEVKQGMLGGKTYFMSAKLQCSPEEMNVIHDFRLTDALLFSEEAQTASFKQHFTGAGANMGFLMALLKTKTPKITGSDLIVGLTFQDTVSMNLMVLEGEVIKAANLFMSFYDYAKDFLGEKSHELPVV